MATSFGYSAGDVIASPSLGHGSKSLGNESNAFHIRSMTQERDLTNSATLGLAKEAETKHYGLEARHRERMKHSRTLDLSVLGRPSTQRGGQRRPSQFSIGRQPPLLHQTATQPQENIPEWIHRLDPRGQLPMQNFYHTLSTPSHHSRMPSYTNSGQSATQGSQSNAGTSTALEPQPNHPHSAVQSPPPGFHRSHVSMGLGSKNPLQSIEMRTQLYQPYQFQPSQQQQQQSQAQITPTLVPQRRVDKSLQALQPQITTQQRQLQMPMFICHTISEDRTGSQESVTRQRLSALGSRCRKRKMQEFSHSLVREETDPMEGMPSGKSGRQPIPPFDWLHVSHVPVSQFDGSLAPVMVAGAPATVTGLPVRPAAPYEQFTAHMMPQLIDDNYPREQMAAKIKELWDGMTTGERGLWDQRYQEQMLEYERGMDEWKREQRKVNSALNYQEGVATRPIVIDDNDHQLHAQLTASPTSAGPRSRGSYPGQLWPNPTNPSYLSDRGQAKQDYLPSFSEIFRESNE
jgi:hypothetical protein